MAGNTSKVSLASNAFLLLGASSISSFKDKTTEAELASNLYESSFNSALTTYRWRFASKKENLARMAGTPKNDFTYKFKLPTDCLYVIKTDANDYEIYGNEIFTNQSTLTIDYIYKVSEDKLPPYFIKMFEYYLASQFALALTGDLNKKSAMEQSYMYHLRQAKYADSTQRPQDSFEDNPYIDARYGD